MSPSGGWVHQALAWGCRSGRCSLKEVSVTTHSLGKVCSETYINNNRYNHIVWFIITGLGTGEALPLKVGHWEGNVDSLNSGHDVGWPGLYNLLPKYLRLPGQC